MLSWFYYCFHIPSALATRTVTLTGSEHQIKHTKEISVGTTDYHFHTRVSFWLISRTLHIINSVVFSLNHLHSTDWFPGWSQHGHYNRQPNDDGLSGQDCIELRRDFRVPPGVQPTNAPLVETYMWNDRDCNARNYFICERPIADGKWGTTFYGQWNKQSFWENCVVLINSLKFNNFRACGEKLVERL